MYDKQKQMSFIEWLSEVDGRNADGERIKAIMDLPPIRFIEPVNFCANCGKQYYFCHACVKYM